MADNWQEEVSQLLQQCCIGFLATIGEHDPETSMAPFVVYQGNIVLHLSTLARHTKNITTHKAVGFMICTAEAPDKSPLSLPRLSFQGEINAVPDEQFQAAKSAYLKHIPDAKRLFDFSDFTLYQITPSHIQWIGGFGSARKIPVNSWNKFNA